MNNQTFGRTRSLRVVAGIALALGAVAAAGLGSCASSASSSTSSAAASAPPVYPTAEGAMDALISALRAGNTEQIHQVLGPDSDKVLSSGDDVNDANGRAEFLRQYDEKHALVPDGDGAMIVNVGATDWPCPIPVVKGDKGWYFDTAAGLDELLSRRIGRNELFAIGVCRAIVDAEREYAAADDNGDGWREYARRFGSEQGKKNGLYWPSAPGEPESPLGPLVAEAQSQGYVGTKPQADMSNPFHGYYFRILTSQGDAAPGGAMNFVAKDHMIGGFGLVAWPVEYGNSGLKTFITSHHGVVYEKDMGDDTDKLVRAMKAFNPDAGWEQSKDAEKP